MVLTELLLTHAYFVAFFSRFQIERHRRMDKKEQKLAFEISLNENASWPEILLQCCSPLFKQLLVGVGCGQGFLQLFL